MTKFTTPKFVITYLSGSEEVTEEVQTFAGDQYRYDMLRANKSNLPSQKEAPVFWAYILSWAALQRLGKIKKDVDYETFITQNLVNVDMAEEDKISPK